MQQSCKEAVAHPEVEPVLEKHSQILMVLILYQNLGIRWNLEMKEEVLRLCIVSWVWLCARDDCGTVAVIRASTGATVLFLLTWCLICVS